MTATGTREALHSGDYHPLGCRRSYAPQNLLDRAYHDPWLVILDEVPGIFDDSMHTIVRERSEFLVPVLPSK